MKPFSICFILLLNIVVSYAHDSSKAYFNITQNSENVIVNAEFPWTIRKALLDFKPALEKAKKTQVFKAAMFDYVASSFIITNKHGSPLNLLSISTAKSTGHSHQLDYIFTFEAGKISSVTNTLLFAINNNQLNYHSVQNNDEVTFVTSNEQPTYMLEQKTNNLWWLWLLVPLALLGALLYFLKKSNS